jgi:hypothetical protein
VSSDNPTQWPQDAQQKAGNRAADVGAGRPIEILEARVERLEALEGIQEPSIARRSCAKNGSTRSTGGPSPISSRVPSVSQDARPRGV